MKNEFLSLRIEKPLKEQLQMLKQERFPSLTQSEVICHLIKQEVKRHKGLREGIFFQGIKLK